MGILFVSLSLLLAFTSYCAVAVEFVRSLSFKTDCDDFGIAHTALAVQCAPNMDKLTGQCVFYTHRLFEASCFG